MDFEPKDYYEAAQERLSQAEALFNLCSECRKGLRGERYAAVVYLAGTAVECMLRAYRLKVDSQFDERHFLAELFVASGLDSRLEDRLNDQGEKPQKINDQLTKLKASVDEVAGMWRNNYRYASEKRLFRDYLKRQVIPKKGNKGEKAKILQQKAKVLLRHARVIIDAGEKAWT
jgi:hypothetical protein